jgi:hypothetical protein
VNITTVEFAILSLGVYRLTRLVLFDEITSKLRERVWRRWPPEAGGVGYLFTCAWCMSFWISLPVVALYRIAPTAATTVLSVFAISGVVGLLSRDYA